MRGQPIKRTPPLPPQTVEGVIRKAFSVGYGLGHGLHMNAEQARQDALARLEGLVALATTLSPQSHTPEGQADDR